MKDQHEKKGYEAPRAEIVAIENYGVLCTSGETGGTRGGTESMTMTEIDWPN